ARRRSAAASSSALTARSSGSIPRSRSGRIQARSSPTWPSSRRGGKLPRYADRINEVMGDALLSCERVCLSYDRLRRAVDALSFEVQAGSIFALVGPNGAGKTSTLRMLATLAEPTSGTITVDGLRAAHDPGGVRRKVGYLPDNFAVYDAMTPLDYLEF